MTALLLIASRPEADSTKLFLFGPFILNDLTLLGSPAGYRHVLTNGTYHFQIGWMEPLINQPQGFFSGNYLETDAIYDVSPYHMDFGTSFNLKLIRYLETGLSYNRLVFIKSMKTFVAAESPMVNRSQWDPSSLMTPDEESGGADVFTFQGNLTFDVSRVQFYLFGSRSYWDVDASGKDYIYDYSDDLLIKTRDRVNYGLAQAKLDLRPYSLFKAFSYSGFAVRDQYWWAANTKLDKNLVSGGITGFRLGRDSARQRRGLDLSVGYWLEHPLIPSDANWKEKWVVLADWKWNIQVLSL